VKKGFACNMSPGKYVTAIATGLIILRMRVLNFMFPYIAAALIVLKTSAGEAPMSPEVHACSPWTTTYLWIQLGT
jgi:hypothetical protein